MKSSLQRRLLYGYLAVVVLVLAGVSVGISLLLREFFIASKQSELVGKGVQISRSIDRYMEGQPDEAQLVAFINSADNFLDARVLVVDAAGKMVAVSAPRRGGEGHGPGMRRGMKGMQGPMGGMMAGRTLLDPQDAVFRGEVTSKVFHHPLYEEKMVTVGVPLQCTDGTVIGAVLLNSPVRGIDEFLRTMYYYIGGIGLVAILLAAALVRRMARGITSPLRDMQQSAAAMARGDYNTRVPITTDDEVGDLGRSLNALARELGRFVADTARMEKLRRDFIANVSHELRTPLTIIRGYTEALLDGTVAAGEGERYHQLMRDETVRLERLINELLDLSRLQSAGAALALEKMPLAAIADGVVALFRPRAEQKGVALALESAGQAAEILGNGDRLTQLLLILLDNALKFTPAGGRITVGISRNGGEVILAVRDSGAGIAAADLPFIWERFYKGDKSHSRQEPGSGLGLAIAREIIDRHGATVEVASRAGEGTAFTITFPAAG